MVVKEVVSVVEGWHGIHPYLRATTIVQTWLASSSRFQSEVQQLFFFSCTPSNSMQESTHMIRNSSEV